MSKHLVTAAVLAAGLVVQTSGFAQVPVSTKSITATKTVNLEAAAQANWRATMANQPEPGEGCFHASYPNYVWENVDCQVARQRNATANFRAMAATAPLTGGAAPLTGDRQDYAAGAHGLISQAVGQFKISGVTSVQTVSTGSGGILGPNEYSVQLNTNEDETTSACAGHSGCRVWQQFVYSTDGVIPGVAALFVQYWLKDWGTGDCPYDPRPDYQWYKAPDNIDCFSNSPIYPIFGNIPITDLNEMTLTARATAGGGDVVMLSYQTDAYEMTLSDDVLHIATVWQQAEFNVFGNVAGSEALFNPGASINVIISLADQSGSAPMCLIGSGTTLETNNLNLGTCYPSVLPAPEIEFTESLPGLKVATTGIRSTLSSTAAVN